MSESQFKYRLEALMRLRSAERDALKGEVERAAERVQSKARECDELARAIALAEDELRTLNRGGAELALDGQLRMQRYLEQQRQRRGARQRELEEASRAMERTLSSLELKLRDTKALENHRERKRRQFDEVQTRAALNVADEQWMRRRRDR